MTEPALAAPGLINLLFVDDERSILDGFRRSYRALRDQYAMHFAESGRAALELMEREPIDVVISDMRMPEMDGAELMTEIAQRTPDTIRIILTGQSDRESSLKALRVTHQFLSKPCGADTLQHAISQAVQIRQRIHSPAIKTIVSGIANLPATPRVIVELEDELRGADPSPERVAEIIATDIALTAEILKIANSAFMGLGSCVGSAKDAAVMLGLETIKSLVLYVAVKTRIAVDPQIQGLSIDALFTHSLRVATLARQLTALDHGPHAQRQDCFTAGLLHDIGKLLILQEPSAYRSLLPLAPGVQMYEAEQDKFGCTHAEVGAYVLALWKFPQPLVETIAFHHQPSARVTEANATLAAVHIANAWVNHPALENNPFLDSAFIEAEGLQPKLAAWWPASQNILQP